MKTIPLLLLLAFAGLACNTVPTTVPHETAQMGSGSERALAWLVTQQQSDGCWGTGEHRVVLTSLATLAFLSQGETPASNKYGEPVERALRALLRDAETGADMSQADLALMTWCLGEAYCLTRIPMMIAPLQKHAAALDVASATPWHAFAANSVYLSGADPDKGKQALADLKSAYAMHTNSMLDQATHLYLMMRTGDWKNSTPYRDRLRAQFSWKWRQADAPIQTACVLSITLVCAGGQDWNDWSREFYRDMVKRQLYSKTLGWWTAESLGVAQTPEIAGMSESEASIYTTSLMLLTLQRPRFLPSYHPPTHDDSEQPELPSEGDILINVGPERDGLKPAH